MDSDPEIPWNIISRYFRDDEHVLVKHHLDSYNDFFGKGIYNIFKERNPIVLQKEQDPVTNEFKLRCELYLGGKNGDKIYYGKPVIYDDQNEHYMFPNEARLRNMTYGVTIHYDVDVVFKIKDEESGEVKETHATLDKIHLGRFPIMLHSNLCILNGLEPRARFYMGECKNDFGGYFIIDGKEKVIVSQEKFADNMIYIKEHTSADDIFSHSANIRMVSEDASKPVRTMAVRIVAPSTTYTNNQIVVNIPNVRKPVPLFILMRALGILSDRQIIETCILDLDERSNLVDLFLPSIHDANKIFTQEGALKFIATLTKSKTIPQVHDILMNFLLPQIGESNYIQKAYFLGYMTYKLLLVFTKAEAPTDRDSFKYKRIELSGTLMYDLFKEYYAIQQSNIRRMIDTEYTYKRGIYEKNFISLIQLNYHEFFKERVVETGFRKAFKGNWGADEHTKRTGIVQDINRLSYNSFISHLRKINLPMDSSAKVVKPRILHGSQWGMIDPVDSPDGANIGFHKHMTVTAEITSQCSAYPMMKWLREVVKMHLLEECTNMFLYYTTKVFVNGTWVGAVTRPEETIRVIKLHRRCALIPIYTSCRWDIRNNEIHIFTDAGRICRPIFYVDEETGKPSYERPEVIDMLKNNKFTWDKLVTGFTSKSDPNFRPSLCKYYTIDQLYGKANDTSGPTQSKEVSAAKSVANSIQDFRRLRSTMSIIEYIDTSETESTLISLKYNISHTDDTGDKVNNRYTHVEIHPSLLFGVMGNQITFPENNPLARNVFGCGQAKQAASVYHSNFQVRIDKMSMVINNGEIPVVKSRYLDLINHEEHPCGTNTIVAIMSYNGYNVEDSILFNEAAIKRGLFRITYYNMYEEHEESSKVRGVHSDKRFVNIQNENVSNLRQGYDYSHLNKHGLIEENTELDDKKVIIGCGITSVNNPNGKMKDVSVMPKKGQLGFVDKSFMTEGEAGFRIAKVRCREERMPNIGDKFCSRCGQKGTCGLIIPEEDMPFTADGVRPDIIINPHAIPSRMTIGQFIECLMGKACVLHGGFGECTAFMTNGPKHETYGQILTQYGFHSSGTQVLYNGMTGEEIHSDIFIGPTYYMRLKQMVKDKVNYRAQGPRTMLTRQTVQGRANDGGLRIGEMERDGIIAHGAAHFLNESLMVRGDQYYMAVCNKTGTIAIYNPNQNIFVSPAVDGPIKYSGEISENMKIQNVTKFGRSFSIVRIPYSLKLLIQELQVMNVQMRLITEDNIDQLPSMSYSNNIYKLLHEDVSPSASMDEISSNIDATIIKTTQKLGVIPEKKVISRSDVADNQVKKITNRFSTIPSREMLIDNGISDVTQREVEAFGWVFKVVPASATQSQPRIVLVSVILNGNGDPTEEWVVSGPSWNGEFPSRYPDGWNSNMLMYSDKTPISPEVMVEQLKKNNEPGNWLTALGYIVSSNYKKPGQPSPARDPETEKLKEIHDAMDAMDRAKREGNVQEEERIRIQIERLNTEYNEIKDKNKQWSSDIVTPEYQPSTPVSSPMIHSNYVQEYSPEEQNRLEEYNYNLQDYLSRNNNPEVPEYQPTTPVSGGSIGLPTSRLPMQQQQQQQPQQNMFSQFGGNIQAPQMNIPLVATMPMTTLAPMLGGNIPVTAPPVPPAPPAPPASSPSPSSNSNNTPNVTTSENGTRSITIT